MGLDRHKFCLKTVKAILGQHGILGQHIVKNIHDPQGGFSFQSIWGKIKGGRNRNYFFSCGNQHLYPHLLWFLAHRFIVIQSHILVSSAGVIGNHATQRREQLSYVWLSPGLFSVVAEILAPGRNQESLFLLWVSYFSVLEQEKNIKEDFRKY